MPIIIGIDEAGYGPVLGPLVVSSAAFSVDNDAADADLWDLLDGEVARTKRGASGRLVVADSKLIYDGGRGLAGLAGLERAVLAFLGANGPLPPTFRTLLDDLCDCADELCDASWWNDVPLPAATDRTGIDAPAEAIAAAADRARFLDLAVQVVLPGAFNRLVERHQNKSVVLFQEVMSLVERAMRRHDGDLSFLIDKHGGRHYYAPLLSNNFFGRSVRPVTETPAISVYEVGLPERRLRFAFIEKADARHLPPALASMASKYIRELFMMCFNAYWCGRVDGLEPTAGYAQDSQRFIAAIRKLFDDEDEHETIRQR